MSGKIWISIFSYPREWDGSVGSQWRHRERASCPGDRMRLGCSRDVEVRITFLGGLWTGCPAGLCAEGAAPRGSGRPAPP